MPPRILPGQGGAPGGDNDPPDGDDGDDPHRRDNNDRKDQDDREDKKDDDLPDEEEVIGVTAIHALQAHLDLLTAQLARLQQQQPSLQEMQEQLQTQRAQSLSLESSQQEEVSRMLEDAEARNQQQLLKIKEQKIFAGCTYEQSQKLSKMALEGRSIYRVLEPDQRARRRNQDFNTELKDFQKTLDRYDVKLPAKVDLVSWFTRFDFWADNHKIPRHSRYVKIVSDLLNKEQAHQLLFLNDGMAGGQQVGTYLALKKWLYSQYDSKAAIMRAKTAMLQWKRVEGERLVTSYRSFLAVVHRYCHEIRFAMDYGVNLNQIVRPPEGELFAIFINSIRSVNERQRVWQLYQDVGGPKRLDILLPICERIDAILRPGLGVDDFVKKMPKDVELERALETIHALEVERRQQGQKYCTQHGKGSHSTEECRMLRRNTATRTILGRGPPSAGSRPRVTPPQRHCPLCKAAGFVKPWHAEAVCWTKHPALRLAWQAKWKAHKARGGTHAEFMVMQQQLCDDAARAEIRLLEQENKEEEEDFEAMFDTIHSAYMIDETEEISAAEEEMGLDSRTSARYDRPPRL